MFPVSILHVLFPAFKVFSLTFSLQFSWLYPQIIYLLQVNFWVLNSLKMYFDNYIWENFSSNLNLLLNNYFSRLPMAIFSCLVASNIAFKENSYSLWCACFCFVVLHCCSISQKDIKSVCCKVENRTFCGSHNPHDLSFCSWHSAKTSVDEIKIIR